MPRALPRATVGSHVTGLRDCQESEPESLCVLASGNLAQRISLIVAAILWRERSLENMHCLRCNRELVTGQKSVALYMFAQTVGIKPRQKSMAHRISFCPQCSVSLAMGPPPEGALNMAAWDMIRDLVASDPALNRAAWESMGGVSGLLPATGTDGGPRSAQPGGYFEF
ncbi:MAG: hypothetical protein JWQ87_1716 [Candidatus Sulfotelmatobacter sp.]|nr:hypothetical protein [Candidatus Sulfotelmatobacter sp.]